MIRFATVELNPFIDGQYRKPVKGGVRESLNPATEEPFATVGWGTAEDVDEAVAASKRALETFRQTSPAQRKALLKKIAQAINKHSMELANLEVQDSGALLKKAMGDCFMAASCFSYFGDYDEGFFQESVAVPPPFAAQGTILKEPVGVCAQIVPWNFPLLMAAFKVAPALFCGNTIVLKPAPQTPVSALKLAELACEAGLPPGVFNVVPGDQEVGEAMGEHPGVRKISFTGSTVVGRKVLEQAVKGFKRVTLELGGKCPAVVFADADLDLVLDALIFAGLYHQGQVCVAASRLLIEEKVHDELLGRLAQRLRRLKVGDPNDASTHIGPLVSREHRQRVLAMVETGRGEAEEILRPEPPQRRGYFLKPGLYARVHPDSLLAQEEIFGPVLCVLAFKDEAEAVQLANHTRYGLGASVWTRDGEKAKVVAARIESGTVWINEHHILYYGLPFGGYKESGLGREFSSYGLLEYCELKSIYHDEQPSRQKKFWYDIFS